ncbi:MAG: phenylalanine--tRNA ligase subunit alpha [Candidatus Micrarchaeia archaeon]
MHVYEITLLKFLKKKRSASFEELKSTGIGEDAIRWAIEELSKIGAISVEREELESVELSEEGKSYLKEFPEERLIKELSKGSMRIDAIKNKIGLIWAKKNGWIKIDGDKVELTEEGRSAVGKEYALRSALNEIAKGTVREGAELGVLSKRKLVRIGKKSIIKNIVLTENGAKLNPIEEGIGPLTPEMLKTGSWRGKSFKAYDVNAESAIIYPARMHPVHEFINIIRSTWIGMGFMEVSGPIIESAFWNFDALFSPQDHPTREMQDTFFLSNPKTIDIEDVEALSRVKAMHEHAWKERWHKDLAKQALLRTQTTSVSVHFIRKYAGIMNANYPVKLFSVGKVFRNESIDYKHLSELHQSDGIIIGDNLALSNLIATLKSFYEQVGFPDIRIRPSFFPFVEPGLEVYYHDDKLNDNIELCGAGIIRKEITKAMGLNKDVLAWGMGLERILMRYLGIERISELYENSVAWLRKRKEIIW